MLEWLAKACLEKACCPSLPFDTPAIPSAQETEIIYSICVMCMDVAARKTLLSHDNPRDVLFRFQTVHSASTPTPPSPGERNWWLFLQLGGTTSKQQ